MFIISGHFNSLQVLYSSCKTPASTAKKIMRNIPQVPERILDAPEILDDYCKCLCMLLIDISKSHNSWDCNIENVFDMYDCIDSLLSLFFCLLLT